MATFCFTPRFSEAVLAGAGLPIRPLYGFPPPSFAINYQVEGLCRLLMEETERGWVLVHALVIERGSVFLVHSLELLCRLSRFDLSFVVGSAFANNRMFCLSELVTQNHGKLSRDWIQGRRGRISVTQEQL
jgi:hypothetical protein